MARRGAALADIKTKGELEQLLKAECLHVLNVYDGFFGPCNALATNLRDFKMIHAGDDLKVTSVNVNDIDVFKRFRNKSEPAYLMILNNRIVNSYYGTDVEELIAIIKKEIAISKSEKEIKRQSYDLRDMSTLEAQRFKVKRDAMIRGRKEEVEKNQQLVYDYRMKVTDNIMDNVPDIGVTIFAPHTVEKDLINKLLDPGAQNQMSMKTSVVTQITHEDLQIINFDCQNMSPLLFNHIVDKDVLIVAWKMASGELRPVDEVFSDFAKVLRAEAEFEQNKPKKGKKKKGRKKAKKEEVVVVAEEENAEEKIPPFKLPAIPVPLTVLKKVKANPIQLEPIDLQFAESDNDVIKLICESIIAYMERCVNDMHNMCIKEALVELIDNTKEEEVADGEKPSKKKKKAKGSSSTARGEVIYDPKNKEIAYVCPVWTPPTPRSHASFLFLYFRRMLSFFLPMDPPGSSRFVIVVFRATRHEEILDFKKDHLEYDKQILAHGIFRNFVDGENYENAELVSKTGVQYRMGYQDPNDKFILKVIANSEALLALVDIDPEFVSQNEHDAKLECDVLFPLGYTNMSEEQAEEELQMAEMFGEGEGEGKEEGDENASEIKIEEGSTKQEGSIKNNETEVKEESTKQEDSIKNDGTEEKIELPKEELPEVATPKPTENTEN